MGRAGVHMNLMRKMGCKMDGMDAFDTPSRAFFFMIFESGESKLDYTIGNFFSRV